MECWISMWSDWRYYKWLVALLVFTSCTSQQVEKLPVLEYKQADTVGGNVGIRPYRKGGIRLESERLGSKTIYHNYGHGGAGISLAPGSVMKSISQFEDGKHKKQPLAVLGAGYIGLLTADILSDKGYKVTVYADQFPERGFVFKGKPCITSLVGGGYWMPFGLDTNGHVAFQHELQKLSWQYYKQCI